MIPAFVVLKVDLKKVFTENISWYFHQADSAKVTSVKSVCEGQTEKVICVSDKEIEENFLQYFT